MNDLIPEPKAGLTSFQAEVRAMLSHVPLMDTAGGRAFQFEPTRAAVIYEVIEGEWRVRTVQIIGPRRLADGTNSTSTNGYVFLHPREDTFPQWLTDLIEQVHPNSFPTGLRS